MAFFVFLKFLLWLTLAKKRTLVKRIGLGRLLGVLPS